MIEYHHIVPKCKNSSNKKNNRIWLCSKHHRCIYIPDIKGGIHAIKHKDSIILHGWKQSTGGRVLEFEKVDTNNIDYYFIEESNIE
jgi:hypothetical protein